jgi:rfaE bifunctional protein nucleotidyltransferase chain/domain
MTTEVAQAITDKRILDLVQVQRAVNIWRMKGDRIVFTNGCFDILHRGHVEYLQEAAALGDRLIIGVNSDDSVRRLGKAPTDRSTIRTAARKCCARCAGGCRDDLRSGHAAGTDQAIGPDVLVKGGDWKPEQIVGADFVKARGGEVRS